MPWGSASSWAGSSSPGDGGSGQDVTIRAGRPRGGCRDGPAPDRCPARKDVVPSCRSGRRPSERRPEVHPTDREAGSSDHGAGRKGENGIAPMQPKPQLIVLVGDDSLMGTLVRSARERGLSSRSGEESERGVPPVPAGSTGLGGPSGGADRLQWLLRSTSWRRVHLGSASPCSTSSRMERTPDSWSIGMATPTTGSIAHGSRSSCRRGSGGCSVGASAESALRGPPDEPDRLEIPRAGRA